MPAHLPNERIDRLLRWENRDIITRKLYRDSLKTNDFSPYREFAPKPLPDNSGSYYTYTWEAGAPPPEVRIDILVDRWPPAEACVAPKHASPLHNHDFFEIVYMYNGSCATLVDGREHHLSSGDICLYNLQAIHRIELHAPGDVLFNIMIKRDLFMDSFLDLLAENDLITDFFIQSIYSIENNANQIVLSPMAGFRCEQIVQWMIECHYGDEPMEQSVLKALLVLLLAEMTRQYRAQFTAPPNGADALPLNSVIGYISRNYRHVTLEDVSDHFGYTPRNMSRYFRTATGSSFKRLAQQIRFHRACARLRESDLSIDEIASDLGYTERGSFDRAFKQLYHLTPSEYRLRYARATG